MFLFVWLRYRAAKNIGTILITSSEYFICKMQKSEKNAKFYYATCGNRAVSKRQC